MALPLIRAAAEKAGSAAMDQLKSVASQAFIEPFRPLFKNQITDVIKDIRADAKALQSRQEDILEDGTQVSEELTDGVERLHDDNSIQYQLLQDLLEQAILGNDLFQDQLTAAAAQRVADRRSEREASIEDAAAAPATLVNEDEEEADKKIGIFGRLKSMLIKSAFFLAIPALIAFFNSDTFTKIKDFAVEKWPAIKESIGNIFGALGNFFGSVKDIFTRIFDPDLSTDDKLQAALDLPGALATLMLSIGDQIVGLFGDLIGADFGEKPVTDFVDSVTASIIETFDKVVSFIKEIPLKIGKVIDSFMEYIPKPIRDAMGIKTSQEMKAEAAAQRFAADSAAALTVDEQRDLGRSNLDKGPTVAQEQLEKLEEDIPDLGVNVDMLTPEQRNNFNRAKSMLMQGRLTEEQFQSRIDRIVPPEAVSGRTSAIGEAGNTNQPGGVSIINDNRQYSTTTSSQSSKTNINTGGTGPKVAGISG